MSYPYSHVGYHSEILSGYAFKSEYFNKSEGIPIVRIRDVVSGNSSTYYSGSYDERFVVNNGDILIGMDGEFNVAKWQGGKALLNQRVCKIVPRSSVNPAYLFHFLPKALKAIEALTPFVTVKHLSAKQIAEIQIPLPPLPEQRRIAGILDRAEALRAKRREALALLDQLPQAIFLEMFGDPVSNPMGWEVVQLSDIIRSDDSINYGVVQPGDDLDTGIPLVRVADLLDGKISTANLKKISPEIERQYRRSRLHGDEVLVSCVGSIGVIALADQSNAGFNIARAVARIPLSDAVNRLYIAQYLKTSFVQAYFKQELRTVSQPTLNIKQLAETLVLLPPVKRQNEFAIKVNSYLLLRSKAAASNLQLHSLFASLQHRAFRGEL